MQTGEDGRYVITGVPAGEVWVSAGIQTGSDVFNGHRNANRPAMVAVGEITEVDINFVPGDAAVEGYIRAGNLSLQRNAGLSATVTLADGSTENYSAQVDDNSFYRLATVPGTVALRVYAQLQDGSAVNRAIDVYATGDQVVRQDIDLTGGGAVAGTIAGWSAQVNGSVSVFSGTVALPTERTMAAWQAAFGSNPPVAGAEIGTDGSFRLTGIAPGDYTVLVAVLPNPEPQSPEEMFAAMRLDLIEITVTGEEEVTISANPK